MAWHNIQTNIHTLAHNNTNKRGQAPASISDHYEMFCLITKMKAAVLPVASSEKHRWQKTACQNQTDNNGMAKQGPT